MNSRGLNHTHVTFSPNLTPSRLAHNIGQTCVYNRSLFIILNIASVFCDLPKVLTILPPTIYSSLLSLWVFLLCEWMHLYPFPLDSTYVGVIQCLFFTDWLASLGMTAPRSVCVVSIVISPSLMAGPCSTSSLPSSNQWAEVAPTSWLLSAVLRWAWGSSFQIHFLQISACSIWICGTHSICHFFRQSFLESIYMYWEKSVPVTPLAHLIHFF